MLYTIQCLMHKVGLLGKPGADPGEVDKGAASDRTNGQVTEHGSGPTDSCRTFSDSVLGGHALAQQVCPQYAHAERVDARRPLSAHATRRIRALSAADLQLALW